MTKSLIKMNLKISVEESDGLSIAQIRSLIRNKIATIRKCKPNNFRKLFDDLGQSLNVHTNFQQSHTNHYLPLVISDNIVKPTIIIEREMPYVAKVQNMQK